MKVSARRGMLWALMATMPAMAPAQDHPDTTNTVTTPVPAVVQVSSTSTASNGTLTITKYTGLRVWRLSPARLTVSQSATSGTGRSRVVRT